jgi:hypothetical protein
MLKQIPSPPPAKPRMTELSLVREYLPLADASDVDYVLWNLTAYPCADLEYIRDQLEDVRRACEPVRRRGWHRKLDNYARRIDREIMAQVSAMEANGETETTTGTNAAAHAAAQGEEGHALAQEKAQER